MKSSSSFADGAWRSIRHLFAFRAGLLLAFALFRAAGAQAAPVHGWLSWRGPQQNGTSLEKHLPDKVDPKSPLWTADFPGQSTAVVANGRVYIMGYLGEGPDLQEGVACFDAETGKKLWEQRYSDFLSDTIYLRYATSSPTIDPETGDVFMQGTQGFLVALSADGKVLWKHSMMEEYGRMTFPNSRTASPVIEGDLLITRGITANWGAHGPPGDRFYAFDKKTGELVWSSAPGDRPKDNSYSHPYLGWLGGKRVFYSATGDGAVVCVNARTGDPLWRVPLFKAGINATVLVHDNNKVIAIYGTPYEPGQMVALRISNVTPTNPAAGPVVIERSAVELWAAEVSTSTSSPILVGDRVYVVSEKGDLCALDANTGKIDWKLKLGIEERNSCPLYADGKLYVPMLDDPNTKTEGSAEAGTRGAFYVIKPGEKAGEILDHVALDGRCFGTPTAYNGKIYMQTTRHLYCFGKAGPNPGLAAEPPSEKWPAPGPATQLQVLPSEVLLRPAQTASFRVRSLDANGIAVEDIKDLQSIKWTQYIPPTARVRSVLPGSFSGPSRFTASSEPKPGAGAYEASLGGLKGYIRGRILPYLPIKQDFEWATLTETNAIDGGLFAYPPLPWIGARFKFELREKDGNKVLAKNTDNPLYQRATVFIGEASTKNYTIEADVMSDGNRRVMSDVGVINQRYLIVLKGNEQKLEINSNLERLRVPAAAEPPNFKWLPKTWYRLKARVDVASDGSGMVRAKAWKKDETEPEKWTLEVPHRQAHESGSPGLFGFAPQMKVYVDNVAVTPN